MGTTPFSIEVDNQGIDAVRTGHVQGITSFADNLLITVKIDDK
ncbi:hypothetical protein MiAbB_04924 [Microcystis aeruginosa NIES-4285]|uniref:Uncharacterized protein n=1 Tax=Microcystis aeruginosa NIES-4285 TaxID=2497681 RepID=A0A402DLB8_MICAE|nr:hypothetical protein MiAbB_04924 [Microcystis aeruginosa NIES-4285]